MNIRQATINSVVVEAESLLVEPEHKQRGRRRTATVIGIRGSLVAGFCESDRECPRNMVATFSRRNPLTLPRQRTSLPRTTRPSWQGEVSISLAPFDNLDQEKSIAFPTLGEYDS
jgi:hypothetical protein